MLARVLVVDPPWPFKDKLPGKGRGAEKHYKVMSVQDIMRMPLPPIADNAVLFLWRVSSMVEEAYQVVRCWDFVPKSEIVWNKVTDEGKPRIGMGRIVRGSHETCIVAARGRGIEPESKSESTSLTAKRGEHSEKPDEFFRKVERLYPLELWPEAHIELFARKRRKGWIQFGDELEPEAIETANSNGSPAVISSCFIHGNYDGDHCKKCVTTAISVHLRRLLGFDGWRSAGWREAMHLISRDAIEQAKSTIEPTAMPEMDLGHLSMMLQVRAIEVPLPSLAAMSVTQRDVARLFCEQGGEVPEFLRTFVRGALAP